MGISKEEFDAIKKTGEMDVQLVVVNGETYANRPIHYVPHVEPTTPTMMISTLTGLIDYIGSHFSEPEHFTGLVIHIEDHRTVSVVSKPFGHDFVRHAFCRATFEAPKRSLIGGWATPDMFAIELMATFRNEGDFADVLQSVGNIRDLQEMELSDDGVSQTIVVQSTVTSKAPVQIKNPVVLTPIRTFTEVQQPSSPFVLRIRKEPLAATLVTGDGGAWKVEAVESIKEWLVAQMASRNMPPIPVVA